MGYEEKILLSGMRDTRTDKSVHHHPEGEAVVVAFVFTSRHKEVVWGRLLHGLQEGVAH